MVLREPWLSFLIHFWVCFYSSLMHCTFAHPQPASWPTLYKAALNPCASEHLTPNREMLCQIPEASSLILQYLPLPQYLQIQYTTWIKVFHCYKNIRHQKMKKDIPYHLCCFLNNQSGAFLLPAQKEKEIITFLDVKFINCFIKRDNAMLNSSLLRCRYIFPWHLR